MRPLSMVCALALVSRAVAQNLTDSQFASIKSNLASVATLSWELGTRASALLDLDSPSFSVFGPGRIPPSRTAPSSLDEVMGIAHSVIVNMTNVGSVQALIASDGSAGDPASTGISMLLANWTGLNGSTYDYGGAATGEIEYLRTVPHTSDGAISHRVSELQLWSDSVFMVPPFLAYYGAMTSNRSMILDAYNQVSLYRKYLKDDNANNLWKHVLMGDFEDQGHWSTGNAWAAMGALQVLGVIGRSQFANMLKNQQKDLAQWVQEIQGGMYKNLGDNETLFLNYADNRTSPTNFQDTASTTLMAASVFRLSLLWNTHTHVPAALRCYNAITSSHIDSDGWLTPVVNPLNPGTQGSRSPEAQAFLLMMYAAHRDWVTEGSKGASAAVSRLSRVSWTTIMLAFVLPWISTIL